MRQEREPFKPAGLERILILHVFPAERKNPGHVLLKSWNYSFSKLLRPLEWSASSGVAVGNLNCSRVSNKFRQSAFQGQLRGNVALVGDVGTQSSNKIVVLCKARDLT